MSDLNEDPAQRFSGRVEDYARFRMGYPTWVSEVLRNRCGLQAGMAVADVGAGTGMLTQLLLRAGCRVDALEPNPEMRAACEAALGPKFAGSLRVRDATAEQTGLANASVAMVTAGRAFHWFHRERALAEFDRILQPGGWLVLVTNRRAQTGSPQAEAYEQILLTHGRGYDPIRRAYRNFENLRLWGQDGFREQQRGEQQLTKQEFLGQTQSLSMTPRPEEAGHLEMQEALRQFFPQWGEDGLLRLETVCEVAGWRKPLS